MKMQKFTCLACKTGQKIIAADKKPRFTGTVHRVVTGHTRPTYEMCHKKLHKTTIPQKQNCSTKSYPSHHRKMGRKRHLTDKKSTQSKQYVGSYRIRQSSITASLTCFPDSFFGAYLGWTTWVSCVCARACKILWRSTDVYDCIFLHRLICT